MLPSSLTRVVPRAFACSARLPVSVSGTGALASLEAFLGSVSFCSSGTFFPLPFTAQLPQTGFFLCLHLTAWTDSSIRLQLYPPASPLRSIGFWRYRNLCLLSFDYAFRPRLRSRLTLSGRTFLRNPSAFGGQDSHLSFRYSYRHSHLCCVHTLSRACFSRFHNAPLPMSIPSTHHRFGVAFSPVTFSAHRHSTSELLRTLLMVAASKPTSWLSLHRHILSHLTHTWGP